MKYEVAAFVHCISNQRDTCTGTWVTIIEGIMIKEHWYILMAVKRKHIIYQQWNGFIKFQVDS